MFFENPLARNTEFNRFSATALRLGVATILLAMTANAAIAQTRFDEEFDEENKPWQEIAVQLPAAPLSENLMPFYVSPTATQSFAIDAKSLTIGSDAVIRYTMVSVSSGGAKNVSYEGIRCESLERKLYAIGREDGSWTRSRRDKWERIVSNAANRPHAALAQDYLCEGRTVSGKSEVIVSRLRQQKAFTQQN